MTAKLKILFLNSVRREMWGGGEKWMVTVAAGLKKRGHTVFLGGREGSRFLEEARKAGVETVRFNFRGDLDPVTSFRIFRFIWENNLTTVCTNYDKELRLAMIPAKLSRGTAVVARKGLPLIRDRLTYRICYQHFVDAIIVPSKSLKRELSQIPWLDKNIINVVPNGVDASKYLPGLDRSLLAEFRLLPDSPSVGVVARLSGQKGHLAFLQAAKKVREKLPDAVFFVVGDGKERGALEERARVLSLEKNVIFAGHRRDMTKVYAALDVVVLPSLYEGMPNAVLEAMSCGRAVVATRTGGTEEVVQDGISGFMVNREDHTAIAERVIQLLSEPELREKMGNAGRRLVLEKFTVEDMIKSVETIFLSRSLPVPNAL
ncbi:MAG: glycosyltransferase family 4 protein [Candidatus Eisenbacteria bacterium]|nr:glycosyltransferase family 4 protein [Candidatus Eisenbacteria bacterium]